MKAKQGPAQPQAQARGLRLSGPATRARCRRLPAARSGGAAHRGTNATLPTPRQPPRQPRGPAEMMECPARVPQPSPVRGAVPAAPSGPGTQRPPRSPLPLPDPERGGASEIKRYGKKERHFIGDFTMLESTMKVLVILEKLVPKWYYATASIGLHKHLQNRYELAPVLKSLFFFPH